MEQGEHMNTPEGYIPVSKANESLEQMARVGKQSLDTYAKETRDIYRKALDDSYHIGLILGIVFASAFWIVVGSLLVALHWI